MSGKTDLTSASKAFWALFLTPALSGNSEVGLLCHIVAVDDYRAIWVEAFVQQCVALSFQVFIKGSLASLFLQPGFQLEAQAS